MSVIWHNCGAIPFVARARGPPITINILRYACWHNTGFIPLGFRVRAVVPTSMRDRPSIVSTRWGYQNVCHTFTPQIFPLFGGAFGARLARGPVASAPQLSPRFCIQPHAGHLRVHNQCQSVLTAFRHSEPFRVASLTRITADARPPHQMQSHPTQNSRQLFQPVDSA